MKLLRETITKANLKKAVSTILAINLAICIVFSGNVFSMPRTGSFLPSFGRTQTSSGSSSAVIGSPSTGATFTVTNLNDSGAGSLRQAILDANANPGFDRIEFQLNSSTSNLTNNGTTVCNPCTFPLDSFSNSSGRIALTSGQLEISDDLTIEGLGADLLTVSGENQSRVFSINTPRKTITVNLNNITIANGRASGEDSAEQQGGGILVNGEILNIKNSVIRNNYAEESGGGIYGSAVSLINTTVSHNTAQVFGGGIYNTGDSEEESLIISNSTVGDNAATQNTGGGIYGGFAYIVNSTISHNSALSAGGGIYADVKSIANSIVALNQATVEPDLGNYFVSNGTNLFGVVEDYQQHLVKTGDGDKSGTRANPLDAKLGALQNNGGTTLTRALLAGSPAINAADGCVILPYENDNACMPEPLVTDQRGADFDRVLHGSVDIGAFESQYTNQPTGNEQCKANGWQQFNNPRAFKNQGDCIMFVNTGR
jgi:predicted outer membrane repeat protein